MALEEVFGSWRNSLCLLGGCRERMGAGSELTGIAVGGAFVGVTRPRLGAVVSFEFLRRLLPCPFVLSLSAVALTLAGTSNFIVVSFGSVLDAVLGWGIRQSVACVSSYSEDFVTFSSCFSSVGGIGP